MTVSLSLRQALRPLRQCTQNHGNLSSIRQIHATLKCRQSAGSWEEKAGHIRSGVEMSMLTLLRERGFVKDVAGYLPHV